MRFIEILDLNDRQVNSFPPKDMFPIIPMDEEMRNINFITTEGKHGIWEIYKRQDSKLDVRLVS